MRAYFKLIAIVAVGVLNHPVFGQQVVQSMRVSRPSNWSSTDLTVSFIIGTSVCDSSPNVYVRLAKDAQNAAQAPFRVLHPNGESIEADPATAMPDRLTATAFGVDPDGSLYTTLQLADSMQWYIASFDQTGKFTGKVALSSDMTPSFILPLKEHRTVIGGVRPQLSATERHVTSLVGLFDMNGKLLKSLSLPDDDAQEEVTQQELNKRTFYFVINRAIGRGRAVLSPQGDTYVFRASSIPKVQVLDADGNTRRVVSLEPPASDVWPSNFYVFSDSIAVGYFESKHENVCLTEGVLVLYDSTSGAIKAKFTVPLSPDVFLCAQNHSLIYLRAPKMGSKYLQSRVEIPTLEHVSASIGRPAPD